MLAFKIMWIISPNCS